MLDDLVEIDEDDFGVIYYSKVNSDFILVPFDARINDIHEFLYSSGLLSPVTCPNKWCASTVYICLHISARCNLNCRYCFKTKRNNYELTEEQIRGFVNLVYNQYPNAERYIIDMSGSGEPLLNKKLISYVAKLCNELSNTYLREFQPRLVTNGTLLTKENVEFLQNEGVLFGVSIDGPKKYHDSQRTDHLGNGTYNTIVENVKNIENRKYVGAAVTITNENCNVLKIFKTLIRYFPTISIKPVRYINGESLNADFINYQYDKLYEFILRKTLCGETKYLFSLLNGDDYFGKFIYRIFKRIKAQTRCDAGVSRLSLSSNGNIYICPSGEDIDEFVIGNLENGINIAKSSDFATNHFTQNECHGCIARYACGGKCVVDKYYKKDKEEDTLCSINRHLYKLAVKFYIKIKNSVVFDDISKMIASIESYFTRDNALSDLAVRLRERYSFIELKNMRDRNDPLYNQLLNSS